MLRFRHRPGCGAVVGVELSPVDVPDAGEIEGAVTALSHGPDHVDQLRRAAGYVHCILKGEKPVELPVQPPTKYELVINLKPAKACGIPFRPRCSPAPMR